MKRCAWLAAGTAVLFLALGMRPAAAADSIAAILAKPEAYDTKTVDLTGTINNVQVLTAAFDTSVTRWYRVELCDENGRCLIGVQFQPLKVATNFPVRVIGTFWWSKHVGIETFVFEKVLQIRSVKRAS